MKLKTLEFSIKNKIFYFSIREDSIGDLGVTQQIFHDQDYDITFWTQGRKLLDYHATQSKLRQSLIIDAGANIGASVVHFINTFDNSLVFSIEPEINNWHLLELNTANYANKINFHGAISNIDGEVTLADPGYSDWGFRTSSISDSKNSNDIVVKSISPASILAHPRLMDTTPLIFKIDIEGGEADLFLGDTSWMNKFPLIIIELHDWMLPFSGSSKNFLKAVVQHDFDFVHRGENIFLFNRNILNF